MVVFSMIPVFKRRREQKREWKRVLASDITSSLKKNLDFFSFFLLEGKWPKFKISVIARQTYSKKVHFLFSICDITPSV